MSKFTLNLRLSGWLIACGCSPTSFCVQVVWIMLLTTQVSITLKAFYLDSRLSMCGPFTSWIAPFTLLSLSLAYAKAVEWDTCFLTSYSLARSTTSKSVSSFQIGGLVNQSQLTHPPPRNAADLDLFPLVRTSIFLQRWSEPTLAIASEGLANGLYQENTPSSLYFSLSSF